MKEYDPNFLSWPIIDLKSKSGSIPKIIHQLWIGPNAPLNLIKTWKNKNPSWTHILWTEEKLKNWKFKNQKQIDEMKELNGKCDIMRYEILYQMGGFFVDADTIALKPLPKKLFQYNCMSVFENEHNRGGLVACGFMAAEPKCELLKYCIDELTTSMGPAWWTVGPAYFTEIIQKYEYPIKILPSHNFIPQHYTGWRYSENEDVYCDHLWGVTHPLGYERFKSTKTNSDLIDELKIQRRQKLLQSGNNCRRLSILNQYPKNQQDQISISESLIDQNYIPPLIPAISKD